MYSLAEIKRMNAETGKEARGEGYQPVIYDQDEVDLLNSGDAYNLRKIPNIGDFLPVGWSRVNLEGFDLKPHGIYLGDNADCGAYFVDASGLGKKGDRALTIDEFVERIKPGYGYAITEVGQFQIKVGVFKLEL